MWFRRLLRECIVGGYPVIIPIVRKGRYSSLDKGSFSFNDILMDMVDLKLLSKSILSDEDRELMSEIREARKDIEQAQLQ